MNIYFSVVGNMLTTLLHELEFVENEMHKLGRQGRTWHQKYTFFTGIKETRNYPRNLVPGMKWTQE
jgi:hypothetical protein